MIVKHGGDWFLVPFPCGGHQKQLVTSWEKTPGSLVMQSTLQRRWGFKKCQGFGGIGRGGLLRPQNARKKQVKGFRAFQVYCLKKVLLKHVVVSWNFDALN